jgi:hypothetical protein
MKKLMLTIAGLLFVSVMAVNAQVAQDTTQTSPTSPMSTEESANLTKDMELVQPTDVPSSLRTTLQGTEYTGWEKGKVYRNTTTNEYLIVVGDEDAKVYRFDSNGARIEDLDKSGSGSSGSTPSDGSTPSTPSDGSSTPSDDKGTTPTK